MLPKCVHFHLAKSITREVTLKRCLAALLQGSRRTSRSTLLIFPCETAICSRCHGTIPLDEIGTSFCLERFPCFHDALRPLISTCWRLPLALRAVSPTIFYPCGLQRPSPDTLCIFRRQ